MSMPVGVHIAVISENNPRGAEIALISAACLCRGQRVVTAVSSYNECRIEFLRFSRSLQVFNHWNQVEELIFHYFEAPTSIDLRRPDLWLALDEKAERVVKGLYERTGDSSNKGYYFAERVVNCGFAIPSMPANNDFRPWFDTLFEQLRRWDEFIWKIQCDYS